MNYGWRIIGLVGSLALLAVLALSMYRNETNQCYDVPFVSEYSKEDILQKTNDLEHVEILLDGYPIAYDATSNTLFVSCYASENLKPHELQGSLTVVDEKVTLQFDQDAAFDDMENAMKNGHNFTLYAVKENSYRTYNVVFTTLPVINISGHEIGLNEEGRMVYEGLITLWEPHNTETGLRTAKTCNLEWKIRGASSVALDKKSWKLSLKDDSGDKKNLSFLNLGSDDDWLLNSMARDDMKLREKFNGELWNAMQQNAETPFHMSQGEYVEVVINNEYMGLYLLQRRVDTKYLGLEADDLLMKGTQNWYPATMNDAYDIISKDIEAEDAYSIAAPYFNNTAPEEINLESWMNTNLFLQLGQMNDNRENKNMYYIWKQVETGYQVHFVPWDTDMSWGIVWKVDNFTCDHDFVPDTITFYRDKYEELLEIYPDLHELLSERWEELRQTLINPSTLEEMVEEYTTTLDNSGALLRDYEKWGYCWDGNDTREAFIELINERIQVMDNYYLGTE